MTSKDPDLMALFQTADAPLPPQPFTDTLMKDIAAADKRWRMIRFSLFLSILALVAIFVPWITDLTTAITAPLLKFSEPSLAIPLAPLNNIGFIFMLMYFGLRRIWRA